MKLAMASSNIAPPPSRVPAVADIPTTSAPSVVAEIASTTPQIVFDELSQVAHRKTSDRRRAVLKGAGSASGLRPGAPYWPGREAKAIARSDLKDGAAIEIDVKLLGSSERTNAEVAVQNVLQWTTYLHQDQVKVMVEGGWVTLTGEVG